MTTTDMMPFLTPERTTMRRKKISTRWQASRPPTMHYRTGNFWALVWQTTTLPGNQSRGVFMTMS
jgi:hypothetical protein